MIEPSLPLLVPRRSLFVLSACLVLAAGLAAAGAWAASGDADSARDAERRLHDEGWVVDSIALQGANVPGVRHLVVSGRIAAPVECVWAVISRPTDQGEKWPSIKEVVIEKENGDTLVARYTMAIPVLRDRQYRLRTIADHRRMRSTFEMVPGYGNVRELRGYCQVSALGDSLTRLIYVLDTDPGVGLVPGFVTNWAIRKTIPRSFAFLKEQTRSHAHSSR